MPEAEVATIHCYSRYYFVYLESCAFQAVDGVRPKLSQMLTNTTRVMPGTHWVELGFEWYFGGGGGVSDVCAFDLEVAPGAVYQIKAHSLKTDIPHFAKHGHVGLYGAWLQIGVSMPSGETTERRVRASCSAFGGALCRKDDDCADERGVTCRTREGFPFGQCAFSPASSKAP